MEIEAIFATVAALSAAVLGITQFMKTYVFTAFEGLKVQILALVVSLALSFVGYFTGIGIFEGASILMVITTAVTAAFGSNGVFKFIKNTQK